ncbi:hypothetical protein SUGI_0675430 [Cryptomeria japonica]|nr:hypothetical protein SUGI_0675430 [Cryptomeria japonica]
MCSQSHCSPRLQCRTSASPRVRNIENVLLIEGFVPSSPRSPSRLSLLRNNIRLSRSTHEMCLKTTKSGRGNAIFTMECYHAFHFPCITANVKHGNFLWPICRTKWKEISLQELLDPNSWSNGSTTTFNTIHEDKEDKEEDVSKMVYVEAVVKETLHRRLPGHFILGHAVIEETTIGGYDVPMNALMNFIAWEVDNDPQVW